MYEIKGVAVISAYTIVGIHPQSTETVLVNGIYGTVLYLLQSDGFCIIDSGIS